MRVPAAILVVEDNDDAREMVCELLGFLDYRVAGVASAEAALQHLAVHPIDVLFTDVGLPGMSGVDLARQVRQRLPACAIVFSSGYGLIDTGSLGFPAASLPKPYDLSRLKALLSELTSDDVAAVGAGGTATRQA
jgi:CheY-like chemotaxis protein